MAPKHKNTLRRLTAWQALLNGTFKWTSSGQFRLSLSLSFHSVHFLSVFCCLLLLLLVLLLLCRVAVVAAVLSLLSSGQVESARN